MSCGSGVYEGDRDVSSVPVRNICAVLYIPRSIAAGCQMLDDTGAVMLEPVADQHRLSVGGFDQVFQHFQFAAVDGTSFLVFVIDRTVRHL